MVASAATTASNPRTISIADTADQHLHSWAACRGATAPPAGAPEHTATVANRGHGAIARPYRAPLRRRGPATADRGVVLFDRDYDVETDAVHEPDWRDTGGGENPPSSVNVLRWRDTLLDHHPAARERLLQGVAELDRAGLLGMQAELVLNVGDMLLDVGAGRLALVGGQIEDTHVAAARRVHRRDPAPECARAVDNDRTLIDTGREAVRHGGLHSSRDGRKKGAPSADPIAVP